MKKTEKCAQCNTSLEGEGGLSVIINKLGTFCSFDCLEKAKGA